MSEILNVWERTHAYAEGVQAFEDGKGRGCNPYINNKDELAFYWWKGWDEAREELRMTSSVRP